MNSKYEEDMTRPLIWIREKYNLTLSSKRELKPFHPTFKIPVDIFLNIGSVWQELNLSTIFWEPPMYGIKRPCAESLLMKKEYLLAFPNYDAPISEKWARDCLIDNNYKKYNAYFELTVYKPELVTKIELALQKQNIMFVQEDNKIFNVISNS